MPYVACAFYTEKYAADVLSLRESLDRHEIPYFIKFFKSRGYWEANTRIKPEFLLECLQAFPGRDIVYLDADSVVREHLALFDQFQEDIGVFVANEGDKFTHQYLTGTLYLKNKFEVHAFVEQWIAEQQNTILAVDQDSFEQAVWKSRNLSIGPLPTGYTKIFDRGEGKAVVEHFQASRKRTKLQKIVKRGRNAMLLLLVLVMCAYLFV